MSHQVLEAISPRVSSVESVHFVRMTLQERIQHMVLIFSFTLLVVTGLPVIMYDWSIIQIFFLFNFSFQLRGLIHRAAAILLIGLSVWHLGYLLTRRGRETFKALMPGRQDLSDALQSLMHNLGIASWLYRRGILLDFFRKHPRWLFLEPPRYGRYNFIEKFEYLAVVWGTLIMIVTGIFLWRIDLAMRIVPKYLFDVFIAIHSYEAILAFLAIIIWHMYTVHLAPAVFPMNKVWLTGRISEREMKREHPLEYEELVRKGKVHHG